MTPPQGSSRGPRPARTAIPAAMRAAGPLGGLVTVVGGSLQLAPGCDRETASSLVLLDRTAFPGDGGGTDRIAGQMLLRWAAEANLGQDPRLVAAAAVRRTRALTALAAQGHSVVRLAATPEWRLAIGLRNPASAQETGPARHGTYGWPVIPGQALKGLTGAWASRAGADPADIRRTLGSPRAGGTSPDDGQAGTVRFLDALPAGRPVNVTVDILTVHAKLYYDAMTTAAGEVPPPAEHYQPVPVEFLAVTGPFAVDLVGGDASDTEMAAGWCTAAIEEEGAGARTAAGYGIVTVSPARPGNQAP